MKKDMVIYRSTFIYGIYGVVNICLLAITYSLGVLPNNYFYMLCFVLALVMALLGIALFKTKNKLLGFSKIITLVLSIALLFGTKYIVEGGNLVRQITDANKDTHVISVIVPKDSTLNSLDDVKTLTMGANLVMDDANIAMATTIFKDKHQFTPTLKSYATYDALGKALMEKNVPVILLSEAHRPIIEEAVASFKDNTKVIGHVSYDENVAISKPDVKIDSDTFTMFLSGIDTYGPVSTVSRSDVNMLVTVSPKTHQVLLTSIPRDYFVELGTKGKKDKLTHAGIYGVGESVATLEKLFDTKIDYFMRVNFSSVEKIVDSLGGVDVYSNYNFTVATDIPSVYKKGMNTVDGKKALTFVRERHHLPNGDNDRVTNQQELAKGILSKITSPAILTNYSSLLNSVGSSMQLSMPDADFKALIRLQLESNAQWEVLQYQVDGEGAFSSQTYSMPGSNLYVMIPDQASVEKGIALINQMEKSEKISITH